MPCLCVNLLNKKLFESEPGGGNAAIDDSSGQPVQVNVVILYDLIGIFRNHSAFFGTLIGIFGSLSRAFGFFNSILGRCARVCMRDVFIINFAGLGSLFYSGKFLFIFSKGSFKDYFCQCFWSGDGWIRIIWPDPDPLQETSIRIQVAKIVRNSHTNQPTLLENNSLKNCLIYVENKLKITTTKNWNLFYSHESKKRIWNTAFKRLNLLLFKDDSF